jgi:hypothetical protein
MAAITLARSPKQDDRAKEHSSNQCKEIGIFKPESNNKLHHNGAVQVGKVTRLQEPPIAAGLGELYSLSATAKLKLCRARLECVLLLSCV